MIKEHHQTQQNLKLFIRWIKGKRDDTNAYYQDWKGNSCTNKADIKNK